MPNNLLDPSKRSAIMSSIKSKNTKPELLAFSELKALGIPFRKHYENAPGNPDISRPKKKLAVFIDGDFWHGRELDRVITKYGDESAWATKLKRNMTRDEENETALRTLGWDVLRVWESDLMRIRTRQETVNRIATFLVSRDPR